MSVCLCGLRMRSTKVHEHGAGVEVEDLLEAARQAAQHAYVPYSGFRVGAALRACGRVFIGANVENASSGVTICAERAALAAAVGAGCTDFEEMILVTEAEEPSVPCGMCLQALAEFAPALRLVLVGARQARTVLLSELLPEPFSLLGR